MPSDVRESLRSCLSRQAGFVELRHHARTTRSVSVVKGRLEGSTISSREGVGVRVLQDGTFGFASCGSTDPEQVRRAVLRAREAASRSAGRRRERLAGLPAVALAQGDFEEPGIDDVIGRSIGEKIALARETEELTRASSPRIASASCTYQEILEEKSIVTSDGADCSIRLVRPEFRISAVAEDHGERQVGNRTVGVTGGWDCLFRDRLPAALGDEAAGTAVDLLAARRAEGGRARVILAPSIVGLLVHEAIGHTVEADFVASGSVAAGRIGTRVASELITLCDGGMSTYVAGAGGTLPVDDEGVIAGRTEIIRQGVLTSYLHDRESAARYGVTPTGNARAWEYSDRPLIRMRNTWIEPGADSLESLIAGVDDGYLLDGPRNGQADATGEFMFGVERAWRIQGGKLGQLVRGVTISGIAFEVLQTVDGVSRDFRWDLGAGYCGKGQPAKVDAGGPYLRCQAVMGGEQ